MQKNISAYTTLTLPKLRTIFCTVKVSGDMVILKIGHTSLKDGSKGCASADKPRFLMGVGGSIGDCSKEFAVECISAACVGIAACNCSYDAPAACS